MRPKILLIDDERNLRELYIQELTDNGYEIEAHGSGKDAIKSLKDGYSPDVVVLDISTPDMGGEELIDKISSIDKAIPIVVNTAYSKDNFPACSFDGYVMKSGDLSGLKSKIEKLAKDPVSQ